MFLRYPSDTIINFKSDPFITVTVTILSFIIPLRKVKLSPCSLRMRTSCSICSIKEAVGLIRVFPQMSVYSFASDCKYAIIVYHIFQSRPRCDYLIAHQ